LRSRNRADHATNDGHSDGIVIMIMVMMIVVVMVGPGRCRRHAERNCAERDEKPFHGVLLSLPEWRHLGMARMRLNRHYYGGETAPLRTPFGSFADF
jgi:hypothetical protein